MPRAHGGPGADDPLEKEWTTGFYKEPVAGAVWLGATNLAGDGQADLVNHGGRDKAVNVYPAEHYWHWETELGIPNLPGGAFGENFTTVRGLEAEVCIGDVYELGAAVVQISQPRQPCWKLARRWGIKDLALRVQQTGRTGWYFRVLREGEVEAGHPFVLADRPHPEWTVSAANDVMHHRKADVEAARALASCAALSESWRASLLRRASCGKAESTAARIEGPEG